MKPYVDLSVEEGRRVARMAVDDDAWWDAMPAETQLAATAGALKVVRALQEIGYKIMPPSKDEN